MFFIHIIIFIILIFQDKDDNAIYNETALKVVIAEMKTSIFFTIQALSMKCALESLSVTDVTMYWTRGKSDNCPLKQKCVASVTTCKELYNSFASF